MSKRQFLMKSNEVGRDALYVGRRWKRASKHVACVARVFSRKYATERTGRARSMILASSEHPVAVVDE